MGVSVLSLVLPYQGRQIIITDASQISKSRWCECFELQRVAREIGSNLQHDLGHRVDLIHNTLTGHLPEANEQTKNILIAFLKTACLVSLIAGAIFSGLFIGAVPAAFLGSSAFIASVVLYAIASNDFIFPERRIQDGEPSGPWFCPNIKTLNGKLAIASIVWPVIGGIILPLVEAWSRKSRWEGVLEKQNEQLAAVIPSFCEFYKQHGQILVERLNEKIQNAQDTRSRDTWEKTLECAYAQVAFLRNFDPGVPDLHKSQAEHE